MYWTGIDPLSGKKIFVPRTREEKKLQRALLQPQKNGEYLRKALTEAGLSRLIGYGEGKIVPPAKGAPSPRRDPQKGHRIRRKNQKRLSHKENRAPSPRPDRKKR